MSLKSIPITDLWFIIPSDIMVVLGAVFVFLCALAIWRIIK